MGFGGFLGVLLQIFAVLVWLVRFLIRMFSGGGSSAVFAGGPNMFARGVAPGGMGGGLGGGSSAPPPIQIGPQDYQAFEQLLRELQAAWSRHDLNALSAMVTPEMLSYFGEQLAEQTSQGVRNEVTDVRLLQGDLAQAWSRGSREYATVAMRFTMIDITRDTTGRIVDGSPNEHVTATELWTFVRSPGGAVAAVSDPTGALAKLVPRHFAATDGEPKSPPYRHSRASGNPVQSWRLLHTPLGSRLRGNDELESAVSLLNGSYSLRFGISHQGKGARADDRNRSDSILRREDRRILSTVRTIAMVGASSNWDRPSYFVMKYLQGKGYRVIPVNPGTAGKEQLGEKIYANLRDIPDKIDMVDVFRASDQVGPIVDDAIAIGAKIVWMQLGIRNDESRGARGGGRH